MDAKKMVESAPVAIKEKVSKEEATKFKAELEEKVGTTESLLYRRGNFQGTWDDLICDAVRAERDTQIALSPGVRWGASLLPGDAITREDIHNVTSMTYGQVYRSEMTGEMLKTILEDVADNIFNPDPYYQQGGDMVRVGGMGFACDVSKSIGNRISDMRLQGRALEAAKTYKLTSWAPVAEGASGEPVWDVVTRYLRDKKVIKPPVLNRPRVTGIDGNPGLGAEVGRELTG